MHDIFRELASYLDQGGYVMWPLVAATLMLWYGLGYRFAILKRGNKRSVRVLVEKYRKGYEREPAGLVDTAVVRAIQVARTHGDGIRKYLDDAFQDLVQESGRYSVLVRAIVLAAPLAGLLGTVSGMIEMFNSLGDQTFYSHSGGIAGGISKALFTTQMGLVVAVPGLIVGRMLDKRQSLIVRELDQIKDIIGGEIKEAAP